MSPDGLHWAARVVSDDQVHFQASIVVDGSVLSTGGGLAIERINLGLAYDLPGGSMGYVIVSTESRSIITPGGSQGTLCLGGMIGRHRSEMFITAPDGLAEIALDLGQLPQPTGTASGQVGETWYFQAWHRDVVAGAMTSNFSSALSLTLTP